MTKWDRVFQLLEILVCVVIGVTIGRLFVQALIKIAPDRPANLVENVKIKEDVAKTVAILNSMHTNAQMELTEMTKTQDKLKEFYTMSLDPKVLEKELEQTLLSNMVHQAVMEAFKEYLATNKVEVER